MQTPPPSPPFWSSFYGWFAVCWNEWNIIFPILLIFIFRVIVKNSSKIGVTTSQNNKKMTITRKIKVQKNLKFDFTYYSADSGYFLYIWTLYKKKKIVGKKNVVWKMFDHFWKNKIYDWWTLFGTGWYQRHTRKARVQFFHSRYAT